MTLFDLGLLLRRYAKMAVTTSLVCALLAAVISMVVPPKYEAVSTITVSDPSGNVSAASMLAVVSDFAQASIAPYAAEDSKIEATVELGEQLSSQALSISIKSVDKDECVALANSIAAAAAADSEKAFKVLQEANEAGLAELDALNTSDDVASVLSGSLLQDRLGSARTFEFCSFMVADAAEAKRVGLGTTMLILVGLIGGFLLSLLVIVVLDVAKSPIRSRKDVEAVADLPVLGKSSSVALGDQLWANVQFVSEETVESVCLVPLSGHSAQICATELSEAIARSGRKVCVDLVGGEAYQPSASELGTIVVCQCAPLACGVGALYCAHDAAVTVICAQLWKDSRTRLKEAVRELALADANIVGVVLADPSH